MNIQHTSTPERSGKANAVAVRVVCGTLLSLFLPLTSWAGPETMNDWIDLFNGRDLAGWRENRFAHQPHWDVKDGILVGQGGQGYLASEKEFADLELIAEVRISDAGKARGNSGVYFRCQPHKDLTQEYPAGYEAQCDHGDHNNPTGSIYNLGVPGARAPMPQVKDGEWFTLRVVARGNHLQTWVNGKPAADCVDPQNRYQKGYILLQMHHRTGVVNFRKVRVRSLS
jgi:hypothetical protein